MFLFGEAVLVTCLKSFEGEGNPRETPRYDSRALVYPKENAYGCQRGQEKPEEWQQEEQSPGLQERYVHEQNRGPSMHSCTHNGVHPDSALARDFVQ